MLWLVMAWRVLEYNCDKSSDLKEFQVFVAGILRWLKTNCLLGETSIDMQVDYLGTDLRG